MRDLAEHQGQNGTLGGAVRGVSGSGAPVAPVRGEQVWQQLVLQVRRLLIQATEHVRPVNTNSGTHPDVVIARAGKHECDLTVTPQRMRRVEHAGTTVHRGRRISAHAALGLSDGSVKIVSVSGDDRHGERAVARCRRLLGARAPSQLFDGAMIALPTLLTPRAGGERPQRGQSRQKLGRVTTADAEERVISAAQRLAELDSKRVGGSLDPFQHDVGASAVERHHADTRTAGPVSTVTQPHVRTDRHVKRARAPRVRCIRPPESAQRREYCLVKAYRGFHHGRETGRRTGVADGRFGRADRAGCAVVVAEKRRQRLGLDTILIGVTATVCLQVAHASRRNVRVRVCAFECTCVGLSVRDRRRPPGESETTDDSVDPVSRGEGVRQPLEHERGGTLPHEGAVRGRVERPHLALL